MSVPIVVETTEGDRHELAVERGRILRDVLLEAGCSPYARATERLNCGGRGLCATCGVRLEALEDEPEVGSREDGSEGGQREDGPEGEPPPPEHWHDRLADGFGYPRLSCQVRVEEPMVVRLVDKRVWGGRER